MLEDGRLRLELPNGRDEPPELDELALDVPLEREELMVDAPDGRIVAPPQLVDVRGRAASLPPPSVVVTGLRLPTVACPP